MALRLGIFGGSFDPVHRGHLTLAGCCRAQANLDAVWFVPAARQPLKPQGPLASDAQRVAMLQLACANESAFIVCEIEIERGGFSYTAETLEVIRDEQPSAELFLLMGADSLADMSRWHRASDVATLATPLIVHRAGSLDPNLESLRAIVSEDRIDTIRRSQIEMPPTAISSREIRAQVAAAGDWAEMVPPEVGEYIRQHRLYEKAS